MQTEIIKSNYVPKISGYAKEVLVSKPDGKGLEKEEVKVNFKVSIGKEI